MNSFKLFRHNMWNYRNDEYNSVRKQYTDAVYEVPFVSGNDDIIEFDKQGEPFYKIMNKKDGEYVECIFNGFTNTYSLIDIDNPDNYLYYYDAITNKLKYTCVILRKYYVNGKIYYITKKNNPKWDKTLIIFDYDLEGGKYLKRGKPVYYTIGNNKPGVMHDKEKYREYIKNEQNKINKSIKEFVDNKKEVLKVLDSFIS